MLCQLNFYDCITVNFICTLNLSFIFLLYLRNQKIYEMLLPVHVLLCFQFTWWRQLLISTQSGCTHTGMLVLAALGARSRAPFWALLMPKYRAKPFMSLSGAHGGSQTTFILSSPRKILLS